MHGEPRKREVKVEEEEGERGSGGEVRRENGKWSSGVSFNKNQNAQSVVAPVSEHRGLGLAWNARKARGKDHSSGKRALQHCTCIETPTFE